jgi:hypothetical protein
MESAYNAWRELFLTLKKLDAEEYALVVNTRDQMALVPDVQLVLSSILKEMDVL